MAVGVGQRREEEEEAETEDEGVRGISVVHTGHVSPPRRSACLLLTILPNDADVLGSSVKNSTAAAFSSAKSASCTVLSHRT